MVRNTLLLASVSALALLFANDVKAADMAVKAPRYVAPAPVYSWTGCYVGAHVGYGWGRNRHSQTFSSSGFAVFGASGRTDTNGGLFGGQVGCNYQFASNWVVGLQGDIAGTNIDGKSLDPVAFLFSEGGRGSIAVKTDWLASVTGRVGYSFYNNQALLYVKGGGAWVRNTWDLSNSFNFLGTDIVTETRSGWTVGGGAEWMLTQNWTAFVEFNYYNFGNGKVLTATNFNGGGFQTFSSGKQEIETVKIGVNYKFGFGDAPVVARY